MAGKYEHLRRTDEGAVATVAPFVVRRIGHSRTRALFLTGERFDAEAARETGLVHEVVVEGELDPTVENVVARLLQGGPAAQAAIKEAVRQIEATELPEAL